jgi:hypothetical protein
VGLKDNQVLTSHGDKYTWQNFRPGLPEMKLRRFESSGGKISFKRVTDHTKMRLEIPDAGKIFNIRDF